MNFKLINLINFSLLLIYQAALADDKEYFEKSIFQTLKTENGQFKSELDYVSYYGKTSYNRRLNESYSFEINTGQYFEPGKFKTLYINGQEKYDYDERYSTCYSSSLEYVDNFHLSRWAPSSVYNLNSTYKLIGPSVLLEVLIENYKNKKNVKCTEDKDASKKNPKKCSIIFNENFKLDYNFEDKDGHTMFPVEIKSFRKNRTTGDWKLKNKLIYLKFTPIFDTKSIVTTDLPIGLGCRRISPEKYPKIETNYGNQYELEFETLFNYTERKENQSRYDRVNIVRTYSTKMYVNLNKSMNIAETIDEFTNASIRTFYNIISHQMHSVNLDDHKCSTYNLTSNKSLNWFYLQDSFIKKFELYDAKNYSYLTEQNVDDVACLVFEKKFHNFENFYGHKYEKSIIDRLNRNKIKPSDYYSLISTHYYPKDGSLNGFVIPKKIEIRINLFEFGKIDQLKIKIKSFNSSPKEQENYDASKCTNDAS